MPSGSIRAWSVRGNLIPLLATEARVLTRHDTYDRLRRPFMFIANLCLRSNKLRPHCSGTLNLEGR